MNLTYDKAIFSRKYKLNAAFQKRSLKIHDVTSGLTNH